MVSAAAGAGAVAPVTAIGNNVAPMSIGQMRVMRDGSQRWLVVPVPPDHRTSLSSCQETTPSPEE